MAHTRAIEGFEDGAGSGVTGAAARSGAFGWNCETVAGVGANARTLASGHPAISGDGTLFDVKARTFLNLQAYPSANGAVVAALRATTDYLRVEMNTTGQCRLVCGAYTSSYGSALSLSTQYRIDIRFYGYTMSTAGHYGRARAVVTIIDDQTNNTIASLTTPTQSTVPLSGTVRAPNGTTLRISQSFGEVGITAGWVTLHTLVPTLTIIVTASAGFLPTDAGVGSYSTFIDQSSAERTEANAYNNLVSSAGTFHESGTITAFGEDIGNFFEIDLTSGIPATLSLVMGQVASTPTHARHQWYDDAYIGVRSGADVTGAMLFPDATHVYGFVPTAQGASDEFSPSGAYARLAELPPSGDVGASEISSSTNNATSTYTHAPLIDPGATVYHVRVKMNAASPGNKTHAMLFAGTAYPVAVSSTLGTVYADPILTSSMDATTFNATAFGVRNTFATDAFRVNHLIIEALTTRTQPTASIAPNRGSMVGGNTVTLTGVGFVAGMTVLFDGNPATGVTIIDPSTATVVVPASVIGHHVDVEIDVPQLYPSVLADAYKYLTSYFLRARRDTSPISIHDVLNDAPNTCEFTTDDATDPPQPKQEIQIIDRHGNLLFGGAVQTVAFTYEDSPDNPVWHATVTDYTDELNRFRPYGSWSKISATTVVEELFATYAPDFTTEFLQADLPVITVSFSRAETLSQALSRICKLINGFFYTDYAKRLHLGRKAIGQYASAGATIAPTMTRTTNIGASFPTWSMYSGKEQYRTAFIDASGRESLGGVLSPIYIYNWDDSAQGAVKQVHFDNVQIGPPGTVARRVHVAGVGVSGYSTSGNLYGNNFPIPLASWPDPVWIERDPIPFSGTVGSDNYFGNFIFGSGDGGFFIQDNVTTSFDRFDPVHPWGGGSSPSEPYFFYGVRLPEDYVPAPVEPDPPDPLDVNNTTLLLEPAPLKFILDGTGIRTRVWVKGATARLTKNVPENYYYFPIDDIGIIPPTSNVQVKVGDTILTSQFTSTLTDSQAAFFGETFIQVFVIVPEVHPAFPAGTDVSLYIKYDDTHLQEALAAIIDDTSLTQPGVYEGYLEGDFRTVDDMITAAKSDLNLFGRAVQGIDYYTVDTKTKSGKTVLVDLPMVDTGGIFDPNIFDDHIFDTVSPLGIFGEFLIQDVSVTDIDVNDDFIARYHVVASPVRFTFYDLIQRVVLDTSR